MATYYVDASRPDDSGAGTSTATAKKTYAAGVALLSSGDTLKIRAGRCYDHTGTDFVKIQSLSNITIEPYDLPAISSRQDQWDNYPILDGLVWESSSATGWTHEGDGVWSKNFGATSTSHTPRRMWVGASNTGVLISQRTVGSARRRTPGATADNLTAIKAALSADQIWHPGGSATGFKTFVYTGSTSIAPPAFYSGLAFCMLASDRGTYCNMQIIQSDNITVRKIHGRGAYQNAFFVQTLTANTRTTHDIRLEDCFGSCMYVAGFSVRAGNENVLGHKKIWNVRLERCVGDMVTTENEQDPSTAYSFTALSNMYEITGPVYNCFAIDCETYNAGHVSIVVGLGFNNRYVPENCGFLRHYSYWEDFCSYARGMSTNRGNNIFVVGCHFDGQNVRSQIVDGIVASNLWTRLRPSIRKPGTDDVVAFELYSTDWGQTVYGNDRYVISQPTKLIFANNVIVDCPCIYQALQLVTYGGSGYPVPDPDGLWQSMWIANNLILDRVAPTRPWLAAWHNGGTTVWTQVIKNNLVWTGSGGPAPFTKWGGTSHAVNTCRGESGTITSDPLINETTWKVAAGSPAIGAGYHVGYYPDGEGKYFNPKPSIGLYEQDAVVVARNPRV